MRSLYGFLRCCSVVLALTLCADGLALAATDPASAASMKQMVQARGVGKGVRIHELDGTMLRGTIVSIGDDNFAMQVGSKPVVEVPFAKVAQVQGPGLSKGAKIWIGVGAGVVVLAAVVGYIAAHALDNFPKTIPI